jgi:hypothetical protein
MVVRKSVLARREAPRIAQEFAEEHPFWIAMEPAICLLLCLPISRIVQELAAERL